MSQHDIAEHLLTDSDDSTNFRDAEKKNEVEDSQKNSTKSEGNAGIYTLR